MRFTITNKYTMYVIEAPDLEAAQAIAEAHHTHAAKRGWSWTWQQVGPRRWFLDIRNSKGTPMSKRGYGCSLTEQGRR